MALAALAAVSLATVAPGGAAGAEEPATPATPEGFTEGEARCCGPAVPTEPTSEKPYYRFVSHPDFLNADVGDLDRLDTWYGERRRRRGETYNSWNQSYADALDVVLGAIKAEQPDDILVAGDLVKGHWGVDSDEVGIFGRVDTAKRFANAVGRAGKFYYREWKRLFSSRGLPKPHVTVGDHEIGDNNWPRGSFKHRAVPRFKRTVANALLGGRYPARRRPVGTAYARTSYWTPLNKNVMLVSVDTMRRHPRNTHPKFKAVVGSLDRGHLRWFRRTLAHGKRRFTWVIVQAHTPIVGPVRFSGSSRMRLRGGRKSAMWKAMVRHDVDLYLSGEVHDVTAIDLKGDNPVQLSHGGLFAFNGSKYVTADFYPNRIELSSYGFSARRWSRDSPRLWQTSQQRGPAELEYRPGPVLRGSATLYRGGAFRRRSGDLAPAADLGWKR